MLFRKLVSIVTLLSFTFSLGAGNYVTGSPSVNTKSQAQSKRIVVFEHFDSIT